MTGGHRGQSGIYNASGPTVPMTWEQVLHSLAKLTDKPVRFRWATQEALKEVGMRLPLVRPN